MTDLNSVNKRAWRNSYRFSLSLQMIGLVIVLLLVCAVLMRVYSDSVTTGLKAEALNKGVQLCRNAGELYTENGDIGETAALLGGEAQKDGKTAVIYFDRELNSTDESRGWIKMELSDSGASPDGLHTCDISVTRDGEPVYDLSVKVFVPEKGV